MSGWSILNGSCEMSLPLVLEDGCACGPDLMRIIEGVHAPDTDRRRRARVPLALTVYLFRTTGDNAVEGKTKNVSCEGFYCYVREPFAVDESLRCILVVPAFDPEYPNHVICLECLAKVLRVEPVEAGNYGVACRIDDYKVASRFARDEITRDIVYPNVVSG